MGTNGDLVSALRDFILNNLAPESADAVVNYLDHMLANLNLKTIGISSFASVLFTLVLLLRQIEEALNRIWLVHKGRNPITRFMYFWTFLTFGAVVVGVAIGFSSGFDLKNLIGLDAQSAVVPDKGLGGSIAAWVSPFLFFFFIYKVVPNCRVFWRNAAIGAAASAFFLNQASRLYGLFVVDSKSYQTLYGALAMLPVFLTWLYICWIIILVGALISWRLQEGFPKDQAEGALDGATKPLDLLRNTQIQGTLPLVALLAVHKRFQEGRGDGLSSQDLAHRLHLPAAWVSDAISGLEALGYVVAAKPHGEDGISVLDPFYPTRPATALMLPQVLSDMAKPMNDWMAHWHHDFPADFPGILAKIRSLEIGVLGKTTLAQVLS
jgi:membrane protein